MSTKVRRYFKARKLLEVVYKGPRDRCSSPVGYFRWTLSAAGDHLLIGIWMTLSRLLLLPSVTHLGEFKSETVNARSQNLPSTVPDRHLSVQYSAVQCSANMQMQMYLKALPRTADRHLAISACTAGCMQMKSRYVCPALTQFLSWIRLCQ